MQKRPIHKWLLAYVIVRIWIVPVKQNLSSLWRYPQLRIAIYTYISTNYRFLPENPLLNAKML